MLYAMFRCLLIFLLMPYFAAAAADAPLLAYAAPCRVAAAAITLLICLIRAMMLLPMMPLMRCHAGGIIFDGLPLRYLFDISPLMPCCRRR